MQLSLIEKKRCIDIARQLTILNNKEKARESFYKYCQLTSPDFYNQEKYHLKYLCDILQEFHEDKLIDEKTNKPYKILIIEMAPRHGKTRTLIKFCCWILGNNRKLKIITAAYNDDLAFDFSKFTRNDIIDDPIDGNDFCFKNIFEKIAIKKDDASQKKWSLEGTHFTFKSAGKGGAITGKGGNYLIIDDPVKSAEDAYNELQLEKDWLWYTGTWLSRKEHNAKEIICHTPWSKNDIGGKVQENKNMRYFLIKFPAYDGKKMLCESILDYDEYALLQKTMDEVIFAANYDLKRIDIKGLLYGSNFKTYINLPKDEKGNDLYNEFILFGDTADQGDDFFCTIAVKLYNGLAYVIDIYYSQESVEITEPEVAALIARLLIPYVRIESNAGGHAIALHIDTILKKEYSWNGTIVEDIPQTKNKESRILSNAKAVKEKIIFPIDWKTQWPIFYKAITEFQKRGKNKHDDGPDVLTQIIEYMQDGTDGNFFIRRN